MRWQGIKEKIGNITWQLEIAISKVDPLKKNPFSILTSKREVLAVAAADATNKPSNSRLYGSFLNPVQSVDHESHSPFLRKRPNSHKEKSENEIPMVLAVVTHRRQDGDPLVYEQHHVKLQGYLSSKVVKKKKRERESLSKPELLISEEIEN